MARSGDEMMAQMLRQMGTGSLDEQEDAARQANAAILEEEMRQADAEAQIVRRALDSDAGRAFVAWLERKTIRRRANGEEAGAQACEAYALAKAKREGQDAIYWMIVDALEYGRDDGQRENGA